MTLTDVLKHLGNYFERDYESGNFTISANTIEVNKSYKTGQYVRIMDSLLNDGVYKVVSATDGEIILQETLSDETFNGYIVSLAIPSNVVDISKQMQDYQAMVAKGIASESVPNYSVSYSSQSVWQSFDDILKPYSKPYRGRYAFIKDLG